MKSIIITLFFILLNITKSKISIKKFNPVNIYLVIDNILTELKINSEIKYSYNPDIELVNYYNFTYDLYYGDILNLTIYNFNGPAGFMVIFEMMDPNGNYIYETTEYGRNGWIAPDEMRQDTYYQYSVQTKTKIFHYPMLVMHSFYHQYFNVYFKFPFFHFCKNKFFFLNSYTNEYEFNVSDSLILDSKNTDNNLQFYIIFKENTNNLYNINHEQIIPQKEYLYNENFIYKISDSINFIYKYYFKTKEAHEIYNDCIITIDTCFLTCFDCDKKGNKIKHECNSCKNNYAFLNNILYYDNCFNETKMNIEEVLENNINYFIDNFIAPIGDDYLFYLYPSNLSGINPNTSKRNCVLDLSSCLDILKNQFNLVNLYIEEIEIIKSDYQMNNVIYSIYDNYFNKINLEVCTNKIKITCKIKDYYNNVVEKIKKEKLDFFNSEIEYYNNNCYQKKKEKYINIIKRREYFPYFEIPTECNYESINLDENTISTICDIQTNMKLSSYKPLKLNEYKRKHNIIYLKCVKLLSVTYNLFVNLGFWFILCIIILKLYLIFRFNYKEIPNLKTNITEENKPIDNSNKAKNLNTENKISDIKIDNNNVIIYSNYDTNPNKTYGFNNIIFKIIEFFSLSYKIIKAIFNKNKFNQFSFDFSMSITELIFYFLFGVILFDYSHTFHFIKYDRIKLKINFMRAFYSFIFGFILQKLLLFIINTIFNLNQKISVDKISIYKRKKNIFLIIDLFFILFIWYYFTIFCIIFNNKQLIWFLFSIISELFEIIFILFLCMILVFIEYINSKNKLILYIESIINGLLNKD